MSQRQVFEHRLRPTGQQLVRRLTIDLNLEMSEKPDMHNTRPFRRLDLRQ
jgi:hypothetical protein